MPATQRRRASKQQRHRHRRRGNGGTTAPLTHAQIIAAAAKKWHVPLWVMYGVWGIETGFGGASKHPTTSSAGAEGPFQFIPSTAAAYNVDVTNFASSANGAAHYLHDLKKQTGSWNGAIEGYGGGYTASDVKAKAAEKGVTPHNSRQKTQTALGSLPAGTTFVGLKDWLEHPTDPGQLFSPEGPPGAGSHPNSDEPGIGPGSGGSIFNFPGEILQASTAVTAILTTLLDIHFWIRVGMAVGAFILLYMGLQSLTGQGPSAGEVARRGVETGAAVAVVK